MNKPTPGPWRMKEVLERPTVVVDELGNVWVSQEATIFAPEDILIGAVSLSTAGPGGWPAVKNMLTYRANAALIVAAVNACFAVNPDNPLAVAEALPELVYAARRAHDFMSGGVVESYPLSVNHLLEVALAKLEEGRIP